MSGYGPLFHLSEAYRGLRANSLVNLLAAGTVCLAMLLVGFSLLLYLNLRTAVDTMGERLEMTVYLKDGLTDQDRDLLRTRLKYEAGVRKISYLSRDEALALLKKDLKGQESLFEGMTENPLPDSFELTIDPSRAGDGSLDALANKIGKFHGVEEVSHGGAGAELLSRLLRLTTWGGTAVALLLGVAVMFITSNAVRLALYSRGQEIELMQWIGATRWFITGPFVLEGILITLLGTSLAVGLLAAGFHALPQDAVRLLAGPGGLQFLPSGAIFSMLGGSAMLGMIGSLVSVSRFLE